VPAESLRRAGVPRNRCFCPQPSLYLTDDGPVVHQSAPLTSGMADIPAFDRDAVIRTLRPSAPACARA
jgi:hypothetical protein